MGVESVGLFVRFYSELVQMTVRSERAPFVTRCGCYKGFVSNAFTFIFPSSVKDDVTSYWLLLAVPRPNSIFICFLQSIVSL